MKMVQSFWTPPNARPADLTMGWLDLRYHLLSWVLSAHSIRNFYPQLELVTDALGADLLIGELQLPYTNWRLDLEGLDLGLPPAVWAAKKMFTYTIQEEPFIHLDGDVFLWAPFPAALLAAPLCAQNEEVEVPLYRSGLRDIKAHFAHQPHEIKELLNSRRPLIASNAGIIGGHDLAFIRQYVEFGWTFLRQNRASLGKVNLGQQTMIIEQLFFWVLAQTAQIPIAHLLAEPTQAHQFPNLTNFPGVPGHCTYIHLMGGKKYPSVCEQLEQRVRLDYPEAYFRVVEYLRKIGQGQHIFFFSQAEEGAAASGATPVRHLARAEPRQQFSRTLELLQALKIRLPLAASGWNAPDFVPWARQAILRLGSGRRAAVLEEVLELEWGLWRWCQQLPPLPLIEFQKRQNAACWDQLLRHPAAWAESRLSLNPHAFVWDCEWDWAEKKEFKHQVERVGPYRQNLRQPAAFFRLLALVYPQQCLVREYSADPLSVVLLDVLTAAEDAAPSLESLLNNCTAIAGQMQPTLEHSWQQQLLERCSFLAYSWVILVEPPSTSTTAALVQEKGKMLPREIAMHTKSQFAS